MRVRRQLEERVLAVLGTALCIRHVDAGSCNACELEIHALNDQLYNLKGSASGLSRVLATRSMMSACASQVSPFRQSSSSRL